MPKTFYNPVHLHRPIGTTEPIIGPNFVESNVPVKIPSLSGSGQHHLDHFLNLLGRSAKLPGAEDVPKPVELPPSKAPTGSTRLFCCVSINDIDDIHPASESFQVNFRMYLVWPPSPQEGGGQALEEWTKAAKARGDTHINLKANEIEELSAKVSIPKITFPGTSEVEIMDPACFRVYSSRGGFIMWNESYKMKFSNTFTMHDFPFDNHALKLRLQQNYSHTWDKFDLTVCSVQMHRDALENAEWGISHCEVDKISHKDSHVEVMVARKSSFYIINVVVIMSGLSVMGYSVFVFGDEVSKETELPDRVNTCLTLILTAVAFKFAIGDSMPKLGYLTLMDQFFLLNIFNLFLVVAICVLWALIVPGLQTGEGDVTLNAKLGSATFALFAALNISWTYKALRAHMRNRNVQTYVLRDKVTWYQSLYCIPTFLADANEIK